MQPGNLGRPAATAADGLAPSGSAEADPGNSPGNGKNSPAVSELSIGKEVKSLGLPANDQ